MPPTIFPLPPEARMHLWQAAEALRTHPAPAPPLLQLADGLLRLADAGLATDALSFACLWPVPVAMLDPEGRPDADAVDRDPVGSADLVSLLDEWAYRGARSAPPAPARIAGRLAPLEGARAALREVLADEPPWDLDRLPAIRRWQLSIRPLLGRDAVPPTPAEVERAWVMQDWALVRDPWGLLAVRGVVEGSGPGEPEVRGLRRVWEPRTGLVRLSIGLTRLGRHEALQDPEAVGLLLERAQAECLQLEAALLRGHRR